MTENFEIRLRDFEIVLSTRADNSEDEASYSPRETRNDETTRNDGEDDDRIENSNINESGSEEEEMEDE